MAQYSFTPIPTAFVSVLAALLTLIATPQVAQAAQCLTKMVEGEDGTLLQMQVLEPSEGPKKLISKQGFARNNCKKLDAKAQARAAQDCAQAKKLPAEAQALIAAEFGFTVEQMCALGDDAAKEATKVANKAVKSKK